MEPDDAHRPSLVPAAWTASVREVGMEQRREASFALAYAFAEDPLSVYLVRDGDGGDDPSAEPLGKLHLRIMTYTFSAYRIAGVVTTVGPDYDSVALW